MSSPYVELDGLEVEVYRNKDGILTVDINTDGLRGGDVHPGGDDHPNIVIIINEARISVTDDGALLEEDAA